MGMGQAASQGAKNPVGQTPKGVSAQSPNGSSAGYSPEKDLAAGLKYSRQLDEQWQTQQGRIETDRAKGRKELDARRQKYLESLLRNVRNLDKLHGAIDLQASLSAESDKPGFGLREGDSTNITMPPIEINPTPPTPPVYPPPTPPVYPPPTPPVYPPPNPPVDQPTKPPVNQPIGGNGNQDTTPDFGGGGGNKSGFYYELELKNKNAQISDLEKEVSKLEKDRETLIADIIKQQGLMKVQADNLQIYEAIIKQRNQKLAAINEQLNQANAQIGILKGEKQALQASLAQAIKEGEAWQAKANQAEYENGQLGIQIQGLEDTLGATQSELAEATGFNQSFPQVAGIFGAGMPGAASTRIPQRPLPANRSPVAANAEAPSPSDIPNPKEDLSRLDRSRLSEDEWDELYDRTPYGKQLKDCLAKRREEEQKADRIETMKDMGKFYGQGALEVGKEFLEHAVDRDFLPGFGKVAAKVGIAAGLLGDAKDIGVGNPSEFGDVVAQRANRVAAERRQELWRIEKGLQLYANPSEKSERVNTLKHELQTLDEISRRGRTLKKCWQMLDGAEQDRVLKQWSHLEEQLTAGNDKDRLQLLEALICVPAP